MYADLGPTSEVVSGRASAQEKRVQRSPAKEVTEVQETLANNKNNRW